MQTIEILTGKTAFLNGQEGLHDQEQKFSESLLRSGKEILILDNLFLDNSKLKKIIECDNIVLSTRGTYAEQIKPLIDLFEKLNFAPKIVIVDSEDSAMFFLDICRSLKKKYNTSFFIFDMLDKKTLWELAWI